MWSFTGIMNNDAEKHSTDFVEGRSAEENDNKEVV